MGSILITADMRRFGAKQIETPTVRIDRPWQDYESEDAIVRDLYIYMDVEVFIRYSSFLSLSQFD